MHRRHLLVAAGAAVVTLPACATTSAGSEPPVAGMPGQDLAPLRAAAREAYVFGLPLLEFARVRGRTLAAGLPVNTFSHSARLADHTARTVTTPNNDTVYSTAFLDLRGGPVTLTVPPSPGRYVSVALMDAYTNNFAILGTRTTGSNGGRFRIVGPEISSRMEGNVAGPTPWVWVLARTLVDGAADLAAAEAVQRGLTLTGGAAGEAPFTPDVDRGGDAINVLTAIHRLMEENPPLDVNEAALARIRPALADYTAALITPEANAALAAGVEDARAALARVGGLGGGEGVQGWTYPRPTLGDFGTDFGYRAAVAINGLAALPPAEAMYMRPVTPGGVFPAGSSAMLRFAPGELPPLEPGGFWSLTMYEADPSGQFWLTENPLRRYAIGDRTPGLQRGADGALEIVLSPTDPGPARRANWLPAPSGKPWTVVLRTYLPEAALLEGRYRLPALRL